MLLAVSHLKCDLNERIQSLDLERGKISDRLETQTIKPRSERLFLGQQLGATAVLIGAC